MEVTFSIPDVRQAKEALTSLAKTNPHARLLISVLAETNHLPHEETLRFHILHIRVPLAAAACLIPAPPAAPAEPPSSA